MMEYRIRLTETSKKKVYLDPEGREGIFLYPGEIKKSGIKDGMVLTEEEIEELRKEYALKRAKKRVLGILVRQDQTVHQLREKLEKSQYDSRSIDEALQFASDAGYVDDYGYARDYLHSKKSRKSYRMIRMDLIRKGISPQILDTLFEEEGAQDREDVEGSVRKYARRFEEIDRTAREKICAHFYRKGYDPELIRHILLDISREMD